MLALFKSYPQIMRHLPHVSLGEFPTPVTRLDMEGVVAGLPNLFIKRDDLSGRHYGGNKVRKLEFLMGAAQRLKARRVITMGFAGSNHALATAIYARQLGMRSVSLLMPQTNAHYVRRNLLASLHYQAEFRCHTNICSLVVGSAYIQLINTIKEGARPYVIPGGGSNPVGVIGYVNAAFELREQITAGVLPEPDLIYVAMGSMGTAAGLMLGLCAAGLGSRVIPVRVIEDKLSNSKGMRRLIRETATLLRKLDPDFPEMRVLEDDLHIRSDFLGPGYACFTEPAQRAARLLEQVAGVPANGTYTAKAFAALLEDAAQGVLKNKIVLFWNTFNSRDLASAVAQTDYHQLPPVLHRYFEKAVQPLDNQPLC